MEAVLGGEADHEDRLIEERRRRRQEILAKHQQQQQLSGACTSETCTILYTMNTADTEIERHQALCASLRKRPLMNCERKFEDFIGFVACRVCGSTNSVGAAQQRGRQHNAGDVPTCVSGGSWRQSSRHQQRSGLPILTPGCRLHLLPSIHSKYPGAAPAPITCPLAHCF